jgi:hypothetical protein
LLARQLLALASLGTDSLSTSLRCVGSLRDSSNYTDEHWEYFPYDLHKPNPKSHYNEKWINQTSLIQIYQQNIFTLTGIWLKLPP